MIFYTLLFYFFAGMSFYDLSTKKINYKKLLFFMASIITVALSGLRWETGKDWKQYHDFFYFHKTYNDYFSVGFKFEPGYIYLNYLVKAFGGNYTMFLFVMAIIIIVFKSYTIFKYSHWPLTAIFLNFSLFLGDIFPVRQHIGIALIMFSIKYVIEKKILKFLFFIYFASLFHVSALVFLPAYFIFHKKLGNALLVGIISCTFLIGYFELLKYVVEFILNSFSNYIGSRMDWKLNTYIDHAKGLGIIGEYTNILNNIRLVFWAAILLYFKNHIQCIDRNYQGFLNLYIGGCCIYISFPFYMNSIATRLSWYYTMWEIFAIPMLLSVRKGIKFKLAVWGAIILYGYLKYFRKIEVYYNEYIPYYFIFENISR